MKIIIAIVATVLLTGCSSSGIIGGGKPTEVKCRGKGMVTGPVMGSFQADCGDGFEFSINIR